MTNYLDKPYVTLASLSQTRKLAKTTRVYFWPTPGFMFSPTSIYGIEMLRSLRLSKSYKTLVSFTLHVSRFKDVLELARYAVSDDNTLHLSSQPDNLRSLVRDYIVCRFDQLGISHAVKKGTTALHVEHAESIDNGTVRNVSALNTLSSS